MFFMRIFLCFNDWIQFSFDASINDAHIPFFSHIKIQFAALS